MSASAANAYDASYGNRNRDRGKTIRRLEIGDVCGSSSSLYTTVNIGRMAKFDRSPRPLRTGETTPVVNDIQHKRRTRRRLADPQATRTSIRAQCAPIAAEHSTELRRPLSPKTPYAI